jgi:hypothetical protein
MTNYNVSFVVTDWVETSVKANSQEEAIKIAKDRIEKSDHKDKRINIDDRKTEFAGINITDVLNKAFD